MVIFQALLLCPTHAKGPKCVTNTPPESHGGERAVSQSMVVRLAKEGQEDARQRKTRSIKSEGCCRGVSPPLFVLCCLKYIFQAENYLK